jgi:hypothetical protein
MMKKMSYLLGVVGALLFIYAVIGRFVYAPTFVYVPKGLGDMFPLQAKTMLLVANTILLLALLATFCAHDRKTDHK